MNILSIDLGSYSVKFLETRIDRKQILLQNHHEVVLGDVEGELANDTTDFQKQIEIIKTYLKNDYEGKVIFQLPQELVTSRYLTFPLTNQKKINMMLPFQVEENLPFSISDTHFTALLEKKGTSTSALLNIAKKNEFEEIYSHMSQKEMLPHLLTSELSIIHSYAKHRDIKGPIAIVDIGHFTSKAYFIYNSEVVSNHISHTAGSLLDEVISETYNIPLKDAITYKHQNCFFLTENQYGDVNEEQQEFAQTMKQSFMPLVNDLKRWELGFRVKYGQPVETIFLTGGTSKINNIGNFFAQHLNIKVEFLNFPESIIQRDDEISEEASFVLSSLMATSQLSKVKPSNFLHGLFSGKAVGQLPLHSLTFILSRSLMVMALLISLFMIERFAFLNPKISKIDKKIKKVLKSPNLKLTSKQRKYYRRKRDRLAKVLKKKNKSITQEVSSLMAASQSNAVSPLVSISAALGKLDEAELVTFRSDGVEVMAEFRAKNKNKDVLPKLNEKLLRITLPQKNIKYKNGDKVLTLYFGAE